MLLPLGLLLSIVITIPLLMAPVTIKDPLPAATRPPTIAKVVMEAAMHPLPGMVVHRAVDTRVIHLQNLEVRMYD